MRERISILFGNFLEFYDFTLFAYMIPIISPLLFPESEIINSYVMGYIFLAVGFVGRPIGAILFGFVGDKYGRKPALLMSILLMAISTGVIGFLPVGANSSFYTIIILSVLRIIQGLSAGGEYSGVGLVLIEQGGIKQNKYYLGSITTSTALLGAFTASLFAAIVSVTDSHMIIWRALFWIGGLFGIIVFILRLLIDEKVRHSGQELNYVRWIEIVKKYRIPLIYTIIFSGLMNVPFYMVTGFVNTYFIATGDFDKSTMMFVNAFILLFCSIITVFFGFITRFINPNKMMLIASFGMTVFSIPFFFMVQSGSFILFIIGESTLILLSQLFVAPAFTSIASLFPYNVRYRGVATGNCLGIALLGGITPYVSSLLVKHTSFSWSPALYLLLVAFSGFIVSFLSMKQESYEIKTVSNKLLESGV